MTTKIVATLLFVCLAVPAPRCTFAQSVDGKVADGIDRSALNKFADQLDQWHQSRKFNGTVLIAVDGEIVFEKMVGFCDVENSQPLEVDSSFRLASVSKQFTAMAIMLLQQDGKLDIEDDITEYLTELPYHGITIRHLLHHTGGLPDYMTLFLQHWDTQKPFSDKRIACNKNAIELFAKHQPKPVFEPGEKFEYSNTGYVLLGSIIENVSGKSTQEFLNERIFAKLEMTNSQAFENSERFKLNRRVYGFSYNFDGETQRANDWHFLNGMIGDGGVYASARDLLKWDQALYGESLVKKSLLVEAFTPGKLNDGSETGYGFGWTITKSPEGKLQTSHGGGWVGFRTYIFREPESKLTGIVLSNCSSPVFSKVMGSVKKLYKHAESLN